MDDNLNELSRISEKPDHEENESFSSEMSSPGYLLDDSPIRVVTRRHNKRSSAVLMDAAENQKETVDDLPVARISKHFSSDKNASR